MTRREYKAVLAVCALALAVRLWLAVSFPNVIHPDETFQYLEQAYRAVTGRGLVPWEYVTGIRSWIIPGLLVPVIAAARLVSPLPDVTLLAVAVTASLASLIIVTSAYVLGRRAAGEAAGLAAALLVALWPEIVVMSPHVLADTVSAIPLTAALAVGYRPGRRSPGGSKAAVVTGALLCLAAVLRPQLLPAIAVAGVWIAGFNLRRYIVMAAGAVPVLIVFGAIDWWTWGKPFVSIVRYVKVNEGGVAASFGVQPLRFYVFEEGHIWLVGAPVIAAAALAGVRRLPMLGVMAALILLVFSSIGHKEYRFVYPALPLLFTLCGVGTVEIARWVARWRPRWRPAAVAAMLALAWTGTVAVAALSPRLSEKLRNSRSALAAIRAINADPGVCGVAVVPALKWTDTGTIRFRDDIRLYRAAAPVGNSRAYNAILAIGEGQSTDASFPGFHKVFCNLYSPGPEACFLKRETTCHPTRDGQLEAEPTPAVKALLPKLGERGAAS
jgi:4-amino-4-deoxy-L-arabinose transferase-like glycosyltransferase